jgi:hypothetical protein
MTKKRKRSSGLSGSVTHHEFEARKHGAKAVVGYACSAKNFSALLNAQEALVHAKEAENLALVERYTRQRDLILDKIISCCGRK